MASTSKLVACVVLLPEDSEPILGLLQKLGMNARPLPSYSPITTADCMQTVFEDSWLDHSEAAKYLGVSKSTLYHYSCQEQIERRKLGGRLEYRRSALDKFKEVRTLPARRHSGAESIITSAHSSGK
jgi:excisionase family DNA binding protein